MEINFTALIISVLTLLISIASIAYIHHEKKRTSIIYFCYIIGALSVLAIVYTFLNKEKSNVVNNEFSKSQGKEEIIIPSTTNSGTTNTTPSTNPTSSNSQSDTSTPSTTENIKNYREISKNFYEILHKNSVIGYIKLPNDARVFALYTQKGESTETIAPYVSDIVTGDPIRMMDLDEFLNTLGYYFTQADNNGVKLVVTSDKDGTGKWMANNDIRFGKKQNNLKPLGLLKMRSSDDKVYPITGWINR